jgi:uncharacterized YccA/Bax inhibitor family protein
MRTANPALNDNTFRSLRSAGENTMTIQGTVTKTLLLLAFAYATAVFSWQFASFKPVMAQLAAFGGAIAGLVFALITIFKKEWSPATAPAYALAEGVFLGAISAFFEAMYGGIVIQAVLLTFGTLFALLLAYTSGIVKATENFKMGVVAATGAIFLVYLANFVMGFFGMSVPFLHDSGPIGIGISVVIVIVAALNLVLDFDFIEQGAGQGVPKYMEWYAGFGLLVTLVWLYLEILRLLVKLRGRRD